MSKAVVIGIDHYPYGNELQGCVRDATEIGRLLRTNEDGSPNFETKMLTSDLCKVTTESIHKAVELLFMGNAATAVFYFAGHGIVDDVMRSGHLVAQDGAKGAWGLSLSDLVGRANDAHPRIGSTVIILDCCHAGFAGAVQNANQISAIGTGVTIIAATDRGDTASEENGQGLFTSILLDGLNGSASDIVGNITPPSLYSLVDRTLGEFEQRPIYKANVQGFITLRHVAPRIALKTLRNLPVYFRRPDDLFKLDPTFEEERVYVPKEFQSLPIEPAKVAIFRELQACNRQGLVVPKHEAHMFDAAIRSSGCFLTAAGKHYRKLAELGRFGES